MQAIQLEIIEKDGLVKVTSPYNRKFVNKARDFRGQWKNEAWYFDDSIIDYVRELMIECFGTTGEEPYESVDLLIKDFTEYGDRGPVELFGRTIARAWGRDSGAKLGDGIVLIKGDVASSGSVKNWRTRVADADIIIQDFPKPATELPEVQEAIKAGWCEIKEQKKPAKTEMPKEVVVTREKYGSSEAPVIYFTEGEQSKFWFENETSAADMFEELKAYQENGYSIKFK